MAYAAILQHGARVFETVTTMQFLLNEHSNVITGNKILYGHSIIFVL